MLGGVTAYFGLLDVAKTRAGETLVISAAAGSVAYGARVIGIAGSDEKFQDEFGDAVGYLDVFFDNIGGEILDLALTRLNKGARIALCGAISQYNSPKPKGISAYLNIIYQGAKMEGFLVSDYADRYSEALTNLSKWISEVV
ncbi:hypothetical protein BJY52DRAFT_1185455 [Lactarius psammicola]|nr:hypothetical protein BJY52DRAFT_1185455 [Lactarius psammicola]